MKEPVTQGTPVARVAVESFDDAFASLHARSCKLIGATPPQILYQQPSIGPTAVPAHSIAQTVIRSAAAVEQIFGGITANLWDNPFEWTLPEVLTTRELILEYLAEVEATRKRAFGRFSTDTDLLKEVAVPSGEMRPLFTLLLDALVRGSNHQGQAITLLKMLSEVAPPGFII